MILEVSSYLFAIIFLISSVNGSSLKEWENTRSELEIKDTALHPDDSLRAKLDLGDNMRSKRQVVFGFGLGTPTYGYNNLYGNGYGYGNYDNYYNRGYYNDGYGNDHHHHHHHRHRHHSHHSHSSHY